MLQQIPAVPGRRGQIFSPECLGENIGVGVAAHLGNPADRVIGGGQIIPGTPQTESGNIFLGSLPDRLRKKCVKMRTADSQVGSHIGNVNSAAIILTNKGESSFHVVVSSGIRGRNMCLKGPASGQNPKKRQEHDLLVHRQLDVRRRGLQKLTGDMFQFFACGTGKYRISTAEPQTVEQERGKRTVKADPDVGPRICLVGLISGSAAGFNEEPLTSAQMIPDLIGFENSLSGENIVDQIVKPHVRPEGMAGAADGSAGGTQVQILEDRYGGYGDIWVFQSDAPFWRLKISGDR